MADSVAIRGMEAPYGCPFCAADGSRLMITFGLNDGFCINNDEFCIKNDSFFEKVAGDAETAASEYYGYY